MHTKESKDRGMGRGGHKIESTSISLHNHLSPNTQRYLGSAECIQQQSLVQTHRAESTKRPTNQLRSTEPKSWEGSSRVLASSVTPASLRPLLPERSSVDSVRHHRSLSAKYVHGCRGGYEPNPGTAAACSLAGQLPARSGGL
jgi:hypothetical protein